MSDTEGGNTTSYSSYRLKAKEAFSQAKFERALKLYAKAIKKHKLGIDPDNLEEVYVNRAVCFLGLLKYEKAIIEADLAIKCNPEFSKVHQV
jgi:tetratricopeptide (TPR) repeat protein